MTTRVATLCPVCGSAGAEAALQGRDFLFETTPRVFELHACPSCECLFMDPMPTAEEIRSFYPENYWWSGSRRGMLQRAEGFYRSLALSGHVRFVRAAAEGLNPAGTPVRVLDVGCGNALLLGLLKPLGFDVLGVDFSAEAARVASEENGVEVRVGDLASIGLAGSSMDLVTLFHVLEHVTEPRRVLAEVHRIVRPGGRLVLQVPNIASLQYRWFGARWYGLDIPRHLIDYNHDAIQGLLRASGFRPRRLAHFNLRDNAPALASSLFPSLDPLSRPIRSRRRGLPESRAGAWMRHLAYFTVVMVCQPVALIEAASGRGATVMIEAERI